MGKEKKIRIDLKFPLKLREMRVRGRVNENNCPEGRFTNDLHNFMGGFSLWNSWEIYNPARRRRRTS